MTEDSVSLEVMRSVCLDGPMHYLGHEQTLGLMQSEYLYPCIANRLSPKEWQEYERPELVPAATKRKDEILAMAPQAALDPVLDAKIRAAFNIHLPR